MKKVKHAVALFTLGIAFFASMPGNVEAATAQKQTISPWSGNNMQDRTTYQLNQYQKASISSLYGKVIVVDPGHGGSDTGAIGPNNVMEKNVTLNIAQELRKLLSAGGATVIMTRTSDKDVAYNGASDIEELRTRINIANKNRADLFISIHTDAFAGAAGGTTTYYYGETGLDTHLAQLVQTNLVSQINLDDRGAVQNDYYVLEHANMPAILTEAAFISNPQEAKLLTNRTFQKKIATGIYNGIRQHFQTI